MVVYSDSDWAGEKDNRVSVRGFIVFLLDVPICEDCKCRSWYHFQLWRQNKAAKEIKFLHQLLTGIEIEVHTPITVRVDNVRAIFMAENVGSSSRSRHIDTRYHFV